MERHLSWVRVLDGLNLDFSVPSLEFESIPFTESLRSSPSVELLRRSLTPNPPGRSRSSESHCSSKSAPPIDEQRRAGSCLTCLSYLSVFCDELTLRSLRANDNDSDSDSMTLTYLQRQRSGRRSRPRQSTCARKRVLSRPGKAAGAGERIDASQRKRKRS